MQRKMFQIIYFLNCNSKIWQEIIMRDIIWKLTDCADVYLSFHNCNSWNIHPHILTLILVCINTSAIHTGSDRQTDRQTHTHVLFWEEFNLPDEKINQVDKIDQDKSV